MGLLCLSACKLKVSAKLNSLEPLVREKGGCLGREFSHNLPVYFFREWWDRAYLWEVRTSGRLSSERVGYEGGFVSDGPLGTGLGGS